MISEIENGMKIECLNCGRTITVSADTLRIDFDGEFLGCPECEYEFDIQLYHIYGTEVQND